MSGRFDRGAQPPLMVAFAETQAHKLNATKRHVATITHESNQRWLKHFALDGKRKNKPENSSYEEYLVYLPPREDITIYVNCGCNEAYLKELQAWSFTALNNGSV